MVHSTCGEMCMYSTVHWSWLCLHINLSMVATLLGSRWKVAICGEYVKSRYKTCSRGTACNFIHCFRNPGGDYEWADSDRPPPKYWVEKMVALFGYSNAYERQMMEDNSGQLRNSSKMSMMDSGRYGLRRSSSRERSYSSFTGSGRRYYNENYALKGTSHQSPTGDYKHRGKTLDGDQCEENTYLKGYNHRNSRKYYVESDGELLDTDVEMDRDRYHGHTRRSSRLENRDHKNKTYETESHGHLLDRGRNRVTEHGSTRTSSSQQRKAGVQDDYGDYEKKVHEVDGDWSTRDKDRDSYRDSRRSSGHKRKVGYADNHKDRNHRAHDSDGEWSDSNKKGDEHHSIRNSSGHSGNASKCLQRGESSTRCTAELSEDSLEKDAEKDTSHARKRSKHWDKVSDKSDGDRAPAQGLRHSADRLSLQIKEADSPVKKLRSDGTPESSSLDQHDLRCISDVHIDKEDRWEPESGSAEIYHSSKGKAGSSESYESGRPGQYNGRDESSEFDSKLYYDDKVGKADHYESGEVTCSKNRKSRRKSTKNDGDSDNRNRSRGSSQSGYRRYSNSSDVATDSSEDKECMRHKKRHASHRSRDHKRHP